MLITLDGIAFGQGLQWVDEMSASKVSMTTQRALDGSIVVYHGQKTSGIPITLSSETDTGWIKRSVVEQLKTLADQSGAVFVLVLKGVTYNVVFDHTQGQALEAKPLFPYTNPQPDDYYRVSIKLLTV